MDADERKLSFKLTGRAAEGLANLARRHQNSVSAELRRAVDAHLATNDDGSLSPASRAPTSAVTGDGRAPVYP
jgi:hypothetical protein